MTKQSSVSFIVPIFLIATFSIIVTFFAEVASARTLGALISLAASCAICCAISFALAKRSRPDGALLVPELMIEGLYLFASFAASLSFAFVEAFDWRLFGAIEAVGLLLLLLLIIALQSLKRPPQHDRTRAD